jgi:uncharacterized membrane protein
MRKLFYLLLWGFVLGSVLPGYAAQTISPSHAVTNPAHESSHEHKIADELDMTHLSAENIEKSLPKPLQIEDLNLLAIISEHLHNKLVHFPVALGLVASLIWLLTFKYPGFEPAAKLILLLAALASILTVLAGESQKDVYQDSQLIEIVAWHEKFGFLSLGLLLLGASWQWFSSFRKIIWIYTLALILSISFTGLLGGVLSHSHLESTDTIETTH